MTAGDLQKPMIQMLSITSGVRLKMEHKSRQKNYDKWCGVVLSAYTIFFGIVVAFLACALFASCSPRIIEKTVTKIEYRDRIVHDTATVEVQHEVEKIVTKDTISHLENKYAKSDAIVSEGLLHHSLESKPQIIKVPVEVHVTDTLWTESEVIEKEVKVEKPLTWWQKTRLDAFWGLVLSLILALIWIFRKPIMKLFGL